MTRSYILRGKDDGVTGTVWNGDGRVAAGRGQILVGYSFENGCLVRLAAARPDKYGLSMFQPRKLNMA